MNERVDRAIRVLRARGIDGALLSSPHNVCYLSGHEVPIEVGPNPFAGGPTLALLSAQCRVTLIVPDTDEAAAYACSHADAIVAYPAFSYEERYDQAANAAMAVQQALRTTGPVQGRLGIEPTSLPMHLERAVYTAFDGLLLDDATSALAEARLVKTADEIDHLRRAIGLTAVGQHEARRQLRQGMSEIALFSMVRGAMEGAAGRRLPLFSDLLAGVERTVTVSGWPTPYAIQAGDLVLVDLAPRLDGYWGDSCNTLCAGAPTPEHRRMKRATTEALARGIEAARPGIAAAELDAVCRRHVESYGYAYPHHSGHALGTTVHEDPRLVPYEAMPLQAGMILALEPAAYVPGVGGVRSEHVILVTDGPAEVLSSFSHAF